MWHMHEYARDYNISRKSSLTKIMFNIYTHYTHTHTGSHIFNNELPTVDTHSHNFIGIFTTLKNVLTILNLSFRLAV